MRSKQPIIGVTTRYGNPAWLQENTQNYLNVLEQMGATAVVLSPDAPALLADGTSYLPDAEGRLPVEIIERLDGLILSGGGDVHPRYFNQELNGADVETIDLMRDELELSLARQALAADLPLFGICRGCQVLNVAAGGGMIQDLPGHRSPEEQARFHEVGIESGTRLKRILGGEKAIEVNTYHHQGVDLAVLAPDLIPAGVAQPDAWLLEAFESARHRWVVGVQWHPERLFELPPAHRRLWDSFLAACGRQTADGRPRTAAL
jgi:putative glutamine amidotransferase